MSYSCLRIIRNKRHHYGELSRELQISLGKIPGEYLNYFKIRFPYLILYCFYVGAIFGSDDDYFTKEYYPHISSVIIYLP